jgi:PAS domain S-box-containing protein
MWQTARLATNRADDCHRPFSARVGKPLNGGARQLNTTTNGRTRGRKLHLTRAKARVGRARKTRADLEQELKACRQEIANARERLAEAAIQQDATSEMLLDKGNKAEEQSKFLAQLQASLNVIPAYTWYAGPSGGLTFVNKRTADYLGLPKDHPLRFGIDTGAQSDAHIQFLHPDDQEGAREAWPVNIRTGEASEFSFRVRNAQGGYRWFLSRVEPLRVSDGSLLLWVGVNLDIEELKCAEQALREREAKIRRLVDSNVIGIFIGDFEGRFLEANDAFLRMVGYDREDLLAGSIRWTDLTPPDWRDRSDERMERGKSSGRFETFEKEYTRKDGTRVSVLIGGATFEEGGNEGVAFVLDLTDRKRAEDALRESEFKLRQITEAVPGLVWSSGPDGEPTHINQRMLDYSGMPFEEFMQRGWEEFVHPADFPETVEAFYHAIQTGTSYEGVTRLRRADGEFRWHHARCEPLFDRQGRVIQWYGLSVDIDERKKTEDRLGRSEAYLAKAQRLSHTGSAVYTETEIPYWSEEASRIFGFDPLQGIPSREAVWQRFHPDDLDRVNETISRAVREKTSFGNEFRIIHPDGTIRHVEAINDPVFSTSGELLEIVATGVDVTERKRAEEALRESETKFRDYAETASDWFWETGPDHKFTLLTENAFDSDPADRIGTTCWDHALDLEAEPEKWRVIQTTLDSRKSFRDFVYCSARRNGSPMYVKASGKPVFDASGEFRGYRGTGTDVTAIVRGQRAEASLRTVQAELAHVSRVMTLGQLTASIAHEVNQPIGSARNNARAALNFLDRSPPDLGEVREALGCIVADADRAGGIIDRIRDQIKKVPPRSDRFDLNRAIEEVIGLAQSMITENGVSVRSRLGSGMTPVHGDRVQLQQVVLNLILNAVEAMSSVEADERELLITTDQSETNGTLVAVRDSGPGIDPKHLELVFEAFYSTKSGMGIGLSICRSIIAAHEGRLWAEATEPRGAVFQFTLPSAKAKSSFAGPFMTLQSRKKTSL